MEPWPKLFQNLQSTRRAELEEAFPNHVACKWIGNTIKLASKHYQQVTEEHFAKAAQNPAQDVAVKPGKGQDRPPENPDFSAGYGILP